MKKQSWISTATTIASFAAASVVTMLTVGPAAGQTTGFGSAELDRFIAQKMEQMRSPGLAVLAVKGDTIVWSRGYGLADLPGGQPVTPDLPFLLASVSKTVTATAMMQLVEQGLCALDDDVNDYLPFSVRNPAFPNSPITIESLLGHDSSIHNRQEILPITFGADSPIALGDLVADYLTPGGALYDPVLNFLPYEPGTTYEYANIGYAVIGYLVERISGLPFDEYCNIRIFDALGMTRTSWRLADYAAWGIDLATPYYYEPTEQRYFVYPQTGIAHYPAGRLKSSVNDLARFLIAHMNDGLSGGVQLLQPATVALMHTLRPTSFDRWAGGHGDGLGFSIDEHWASDNRLSIGHTGLLVGAATVMKFRPDTRVGAIVFADSAPGILTPSGTRLIDGWENAVYVDVSARLMDEAEALE
jgi:CubicO group peptidase (beta-lactamase class C family)